MEALAASKMEGYATIMNRACFCRCWDETWNMLPVLSTLTTSRLAQNARNRD